MCAPGASAEDRLQVRLAVLHDHVVLERLLRLRRAKLQRLRAQALREPLVVTPAGDSLIEHLASKYFE